jgi:hypothetical protein
MCVENMSKRLREIATLRILTFAEYLNMFSGKHFLG